MIPEAIKSKIEKILSHYDMDRPADRVEKRNRELDLEHGYSLSLQTIEDKDKEIAELLKEINELKFKIYKRAENY